jgi:hypothetical protein
MGDRYALWVREPTRKTWHGFIDHPPSATDKAGCGWEPAEIGPKAVWPVGPGDLGPPEFERCQWCEAAGHRRLNSSSGHVR